MRNETKIAMLKARKHKLMMRDSVGNAAIIAKINRRIHSLAC